MPAMVAYCSDKPLVWAALFAERIEKDTMADDRDHPTPPEQECPDVELAGAPLCGDEPIAPPVKAHPDVAPAKPITPTSGIDGLIPYKNVHALVGYYLGIFSLIPCLGLLPAIPAMILGIIGLKNAKQHPEVKGRGHAITAIVISAIVLTLGVAFGAFMLLARIAEATD
jgi:hypothetical protein